MRGAGAGWGGGSWGGSRGLADLPRGAQSRGRSGRLLWRRRWRCWGLCQAGNPGRVGGAPDGPSAQAHVAGSGPMSTPGQKVLENTQE